jgi:hypothetical protein
MAGGLSFMLNRGVAGLQWTQVKESTMRRTLILLATAWTTYSYITVVIPTCKTCLQETAAITNGTALSPYAYRLLTPVILSALGNTLAASVFFHAMLFALFYVLLSFWLDRWHANPLALLIPAFMFPVMFEAWYQSAYTITEAVLVLCGLLALPHFKKWYSVLVIVGTLNREMTGVLLVLIFWALCGDWKQTILYAGLAAFTYTLIRVGVGARPVELTLAQTFAANVYSWRTVPALLKQLLFLPLWMIVFTNRKRTAEPLRRLVYVSIVYLIVFFAAAMWQETRLLLPVVVMLLPIAAKVI